MKLSVNIQRLENARISIGALKAEIGTISSKRNVDRSPIEIELLEKGSLVLSGEELDEVLHFPAGIAAIGNTQITLHIFQPFATADDLKLIPSPKPRYHVADCLTLEEMRRKGRFNRYVSTADADGYFRAEPWDFETKTRGDEVKAALAPCQNCLKALNYDGFEEKKQRDRKSIVNSFDIKKFFENYEPIFRCLPLFDANDFPEGNYTSDWARISEEIRRNAQWKCLNCGVHLSEHRHLLHVHHKDGNRGNNRKSNLEPLCCLCHKLKPFHEGMHIRPEYQKLLETLVTR
jgi:hypothetical protein